ncbi:MAG: hypothetical protein ABJP48_03505 [Erythrobacter sp.]
MADTGQSAENTINLTRDFLGASDQKNLLLEGDLRAPSSASTGTEFTESGNAHELRSQAIAANLADDKDASIVLSSSQQTKREALNAGPSTKQRSERQQLHLTLAEQARQLSEQLAQQIAALESAFEAEMGDAWREQITNKVMDPDTIPQRREGEAMQAYRERLEVVLIATMIDPATGNIRPEYANNDGPDIQRYAEWAQARHRQNELANTPPEQMQEFLAKSNDWANLQIGEHGLQASGANTATATQRTDEMRENAGDLATESAAFGLPPSA